MLVCFHARDYQARRGNIRFRRNETKKLEFVHTLNGSGLATSRLMPAIVEQFQQPDGSVIIPEKLRPWMDGMEKISPSAEALPLRSGPRGCPAFVLGRKFVHFAVMFFAFFRDNFTFMRYNILS